MLAFACLRSPDTESFCSRLSFKSSLHSEQLPNEETESSTGTGCFCHAVHKKQCLSLLQNSEELLRLLIWISWVLSRVTPHCVQAALGCLHYGGTGETNQTNTRYFVYSLYCDSQILLSLVQESHVMVWHSWHQNILLSGKEGRTLCLLYIDWAVFCL